MTPHDIRQSFLDYFARQEHHVVSSSPLVPGDDPTLLFTNAGMNQFKDVFVGRDQRDYRRAVSVQKCMRVSGKHNDLDNVGPSLRHHTFFEMLGNFSFGDYFKPDAIGFAWELLTGVWNLPPDRLYPTIFRGEAGIARDVEALETWTGLVPPARVTELGLAENFWQMGETGPCGRCSEIHYFRGEDVPCDQPVCLGVECSCERYVEVWNNVFMEFERAADGTLTLLPAPSIDTGMGFERIVAVIQGKGSNYDTELFTPILSAVAGRSGRTYTGAAGPGSHPDVSMRVIADHVRAMTFLVADGVLPSNEWRGYVLRKIMRRAMRHGKKLGFTAPFLDDLVDVVVVEMGDAYPELRTRRDTIVRTVHAEEDRFDAVLTSGLPRLEELIDRAAASGSAVVPGDEVFRLYDSLGVPLDFAEDLATQRGLAVDRAGYDRAMDAQRNRARAGAGTKFGATAAHYPEEARTRLEGRADEFSGYETLVERGADTLEILTITSDSHSPGLPAEEAVPGHRYWVHLSRTPFYVEAGGQVSDTGTLQTDTGMRARVLGVDRAFNWPRKHLVEIVSGRLERGDAVDALVDEERRSAIRRNHTATHLLQAALRRRLGDHVRQAGSLVAPDRLRFDFAHFQPLTAEEIRDIERVVNEQVYRNIPVLTAVRKTEEAIKDGAMALFGEKYGETVRVVSIDQFSTELCGGTHVGATGDIGPFTVVGESGVAAGVRRLEALTGAGAVSHLQARLAAFERTMTALGVGSAEAAEAVARLQVEAERLARENAQLKMKLALGGGSTLEHDDAVLIGDAKLVARRVSGLDKDSLRALSDSLRDRVRRGVVVLATERDGKVHLLVSVTKDLTERLKAGQLVKQLAPIVGGGGGGRAGFAEAGGKDASKIDVLLEEARALVTAALSD